MPQNLTIGTRLKKSMRAKGLTASELARRADVRHSFIYDILSGKSLNPSTVTLARVAEALEVSLHYLAGMGTDIALPNAAHNPPDDEYVALPRISAEASAGGGSIVTSENTEEHYYFRRSWIRNRLMASPADLRLLTLRGDSMEPTLNDGDMILINVKKTLPSPPGIFVLFDGLGLVVKRLEHVSDSELPMVRILSDNNQYSPYERPVADTCIIGRVVWFAREL